MDRFAKLAAQALNQVLDSPILPTELETPPDPKLGDIAFPCFKLAKLFRKGPPQVSAQLVADLKAKGAVPEGLSVAQVGPYVNFTVDAAQVFGAVVGDILQGPGLGDYGRVAADSRGSWVIEYSSPNVAKPLNIYHLRPTALGATFDRVGRYRGFRVISINHLGDWGKQYGMLSVAFKRYGKTAESSLSMRDLVDMYVRINADAEKDETIQIEARAAFAALEKGDPAVQAIWKKCRDISIDEFERMYRRLGVKFDHIWGESFYSPQLPALLAGLRKSGLLVESEGAWVVPVTDLEGRELPPCILEKSDGSSIYATRDVAAAIYRHEQFNFDRMTYIVGGEQKLHFQQVFSVLRKMGPDTAAWAAKCEHVPFGLYRFKDAKMSTRKGNFITLEEVLEEAKAKVAELMHKRAADAAGAKSEGSDAAARAATESVADKSQLDDTIEKVAIGAVVFHDLHTDPVRDVEFDVERVVDFEGETGPFLQYSHTRCASILRKARDTGALVGDPVLTPAGANALGKPEEVALAKVLGQFPLQLERTLTQAKASHLAHYLINVTQAFGPFYRECRVLGEAPELTGARLALVEATRRVLARGLTLLGIPLPERM
jgi:arginyl-tRNA synthetase